MTRSKNSTFELCIYGRSMILGHTVFFRMELQWNSDMSNMYEGHILFPPYIWGISYFDCHRCFLPLDHPFRLDSDAFKKANIVLDGPPRCLSGPEIVDVLDNLALNKNGDGFVGYGEEYKWTHNCALWELLYAKVLILMHNIDIMHQERNVGESILSTCMTFADKTKDNHKARNDLAQLCNRPSLELKSSGGMPRELLCLKPKERKEVLIWLQNLKFPYGYAAGFR
jgi:hypothetical protein